MRIDAVGLGVGTLVGEDGLGVVASDGSGDGFRVVLVGDRDTVGETVAVGSGVGF